jgi:CheY-like chemotaxis protein
MHSPMASEPVILVADDDENDAFLLRQALMETKVRCRLETVRNGKEAIDYLNGEGDYGNRNLHPWPTLMLLDLKMPIADGFDVLAWWQNKVRDRELPIVVMSSSNQQTDIQKALALGATAYHVKPASFDYLLAVVRELGNRFLMREQVGC